jgi:hypothetical protein
MCKRLSVCALVVLFCGNANLFSQNIEKDTLNGFFYHRETYFIDSIQRLNDNLTDVHFYNPLKRTDEGFFQQLSTYGSPSQSTLYEFNTNFLQYQPNIYSPYIYTWHNIRFYQLNKPYSELYYSNDLNSDRIFQVTHSQNVWTGLNIGLQYKVNYADGTFANSWEENQYFNATANYISPKGIYRAEAAYIRNRAYTAENGGLNDELFIADSFPSNAAYPVALEAASTKYKSADFLLSQSVRLPKDFGSLTLTNSLTDNTRIYHDANSIDTSLAFDNKRLTTSFAYNAIIKQHLPVQAGIRHDYNMFANRSESEKASLMSPFAAIRFSLKGFLFNIYGEKTLSNGVFGNNSLIQAGSSFAFDSANHNSIFASLVYKITTADFLFRHTNSTNYQWDNTFNAIRTMKFSIGSSLLGIFDLAVNYFALNDNVWLSETLQPTQKDGLTNIYQAILKNKFTLGSFGFMGIAALQYADDETAVSLPLLQVKQTAYVEFFLFKKKLKTQIGVDLYYNTAFYADAYLPELGSFYRQRERKQGNYLYADVFAAFNISRVNLFISLSHPYAGLIGNDYFQTLHYPSEALSLRFGLSWKFFD